MKKKFQNNEKNKFNYKRKIIDEVNDLRSGGINEESELIPGPCFKNTVKNI